MYRTIYLNPFSRVDLISWDILCVCIYTRLREITILQIVGVLQNFRCLRAQLSDETARGCLRDFTHRRGAIALSHGEHVLQGEAQGATGQDEHSEQRRPATRRGHVGTHVLFGGPEEAEGAAERGAKRQLDERHMD